MAFREDLDLSAILPKYNQIILDNNEDSRYVTTPALDNRSIPTRVGGGAISVSSSRELEVFPSMCWDVNGYYREMGVHWKASRKELMAAYQRNDGSDNPRLTYIFRQLLDKDKRREYDLMPPGSVYLDDYVQEEIIKNAKAESSRRLNAGMWSTPEKVLSEWGFDLVSEDESELAGQEGQDSVSSEEYEELWPYSFLQLGTSCQEEDRMVEWQRALLQELSDRPMKFAVGYTGMDEGYRIDSYEGISVFYLSDIEEPTIQLAKSLVNTYKNKKQNTQ